MAASWVAAVLVALVAATLMGCGAGATSEPPTGATATPTVRNAEIGFRSARHLDQHFHKHAGEFGAISRAQYLLLAQQLRDAPAGGPVLEAVRRDGVTSRYDRRSGAFVAFDGDLTIRTFFKPNDGEDYFTRQARR